jgi:hypothetical protein
VIAEARESADQASRYPGPVLPIEVVSTVFLVVFTLAQHLVSHDENPVSHSHDGLVMAVPNSESPVQSR